MIALIDYGMGNLGSVDKALRRAGCDVTVTQDPGLVNEAQAIVLPGVGAFGDCMEGLRRFGLDRAIVDGIVAGKPFLGICLGLQVLFEEGEEAPGVAGLGVFGGKVERFRHNLKVPHIGWNQIVARGPVPHLAGVPDGAHVYFVHSYYPIPEDESIVATTTDYGYDFVSSVWHGSVFASQFHPEKSQAVGLRILQNYRDLVSRGPAGA
jgi:imidazole glycerol-phosphate synthase subunit HisH